MVNAMAAGCQSFYRKIYGLFLYSAVFLFEHLMLAFFHVLVYDTVSHQTPAYELYQGFTVLAILSVLYIITDIQSKSLESRIRILPGVYRCCYFVSSSFAQKEINSKTKKNLVILSSKTYIHEDKLIKY